MVDDADKKEEEKLEFDSTGQAVAYISLDQARVLALQHARDNRDFYGRYADRELVWEVISADETEDYYEVRLSYRPAGNFRAAGVEHFTIDKTGPIEFRQIIRQPRLSRSVVAGIAFAVFLAATGTTIGGLFASGAFSSSGGAEVAMREPEVTPAEVPIREPTSTTAATPTPVTVATPVPTVKPTPRILNPTSTVTRSPATSVNAKMFPELVLRGVTDTGWSPVALAKQGNHLFVAAGADGLRVLHEQKPGVLEEVGSADTPGLARAIQVHGSFLFLIEDTNWLVVFDVSNPANPVQIATLDPGRGGSPDAFSILVEEPYAFVGSRVGVDVVNINDPRNPLIFASTEDPQRIDFNSRPWTLAIVGDTLYMPTNNRIALIDVSDIESIARPRPGGAERFANVKGEVLGIVADESYLYAAYGPGVQIFDTSTDGPTAISEVVTQGTAQGLALDRHLLFIADGISGLLMVDVEDPTNPTVVHQNREVVASTVITDESLVYVATNDQRIATFELVTEVCGRASEQWRPPGVYRLTCDVEVDRGSRLEILPGTKVEFVQKSGGALELARLKVDGHLEVRGTPSSPVEFVAEGTRSPGTLGRVRLRGSGFINYAIFRGTNLEAGTDSIIANNIFIGNNWYGLSGGGGVVTNNLFMDSADGIRLLGSASPTIVNNLFLENGVGINCEHSSQPSSPQLGFNAYSPDQFVRMECPAELNPSEIGVSIVLPSLNTILFSDLTGVPSQFITDRGSPEPRFNDTDGSRNDIGPLGGPYAQADSTPTPVPTSKSTATPTPTLEPIEISGQGKQVSQLFNLASGLTTFRITHDGQSNFFIWLLDGQENTVDLLVNEVGAFDGSTAIEVRDAGVYILDINADGIWTVKIDQ